MSPYFVLLMLMALAYNVSAQGGGNTTAPPRSTESSRISESSSSSETTTPGDQNSTLPPNTPPDGCPVNEIRARTVCECTCEQSCGSTAQQRPFECRIFILGRPACTFMRPGPECCTCQAGYVRNSENRCVLPMNCATIL